MKQKYQLGLAHTHPFMVPPQHCSWGRTGRPLARPSKVHEFVREKLQAAGSQVRQALRLPGRRQCEEGLKVCGLNTTKPLPYSRLNMQEEAPLHKHKHSANEQLAQSGARCAFYLSSPDKRQRLFQGTPLNWESHLSK